MNQNQLSYSKFTLALVKENLNVLTQTEVALFTEVAPVEISDYLRKTIQQFAPLALAINTEKSRSEWLIAPILAEVRERLQHRISLFSGFEFNVDAQQGLVGVCDYIICQSPEQYYLTAPVVMIIEAKKENINAGLGQCIAAMVGAQRFNQQAGNPISTIYGAVTMGNQWKFLKLTGNVAYIDRDDYYLDNIQKIVGILSAISAVDITQMQAA